MPRKNITKKTPEEIAARKHAWHIANREQISARKRANREAHREELNAKGRAKYAENQEKMRTKGRASYAIHKDWHAAYRAAHREKRDAQTRDWKAAHREELATYHREWYGQNQEHIAAYNAAHREERARYQRERRERKLANGGAHSPEEWTALLHYFGDVCLVCGCPDVIADHVVPIVVGGSDDIENLQPLCQPCNNKKGTQEIDYRNPVQLHAFLDVLEGA